MGTNLARAKRLRFNKKAYRKNIAKLTLRGLRDALVREAELRFNASIAMHALRQEIVDIRSPLLEQISQTLDKQYGRAREIVEHGSGFICSKPPRKR